MPLEKITGHEPDIYDEKDVLGEHLFAKVSEIGLDFHHSQQITGILLECNTDDVFKMLKDESFLESRVELATDALLKNGLMERMNNASDTEVSATHDPELSEELYESVHNIEPELSNQIAGMLLELSSTDIQRLLDSPEELREAVEKAKEAIVADVSTDLTAVRESVGERIYEAVVKIYPDHAAKITGMMLEMKTDQLEEILCQDSCLTDRIHQAYNILKQQKDVL